MMCSVYWIVSDYYVVFSCGNFVGMLVDMDECIEWMEMVGFLLVGIYVGVVVIGVGVF